MNLGGYTGVALSVCLCGMKSCAGQNFKSIKASNFKLHTQIGHLVEKCIVQEPELYIPSIFGLTALCKF